MLCWPLLMCYAVSVVSPLQDLLAQLATSKGEEQASGSTEPAADSVAATLKIVTSLQVRHCCCCPRQNRVVCLLSCSSHKFIVGSIGGHQHICYVYVSVSTNPQSSASHKISSTVSKASRGSLWQFDRTSCSGWHLQPLRLAEQHETPTAQHNSYADSSHIQMYQQLTQCTKQSCGVPCVCGRGCSGFSGGHAGHVG